jgi:hypothetical protein
MVLLSLYTLLCVCVCVSWEGAYSVVAKLYFLFPLFLCPEQRRALSFVTTQTEATGGRHGQTGKELFSCCVGHTSCWSI